MLIRSVGQKEEDTQMPVTAARQRTGEVRATTITARFHHPAGEYPAS